MSRTLAATLVAILVSGCASLINSAASRMADNVTLAILNQDDLETVRDGAPAYMLMIDGLIAGAPDDADLLLSGAKLYGSYTTAFIDEPGRAQRLAERALEYAQRALCVEAEAVCAALDEKLAAFRASLAATRRGDLKVLYGFAAAWAGWIEVNARDWNAIARVSKMAALFERCVELDETYDGGGAHLYLGVVKSLLPPALGGKPDEARAHFERALEISDGRNLMVRVLMAEHYARAVFDRELHDGLLTTVIEAQAEYPGYTLINMLAKREAGRLLAESADFF